MSRRLLERAVAEGRLRDAGRFRRVSLDTYRAQGVPIEPYTESYISLESTIDAGAYDKRMRRSRRATPSRRTRS